MVVDIQRASVWKRVAAWMLDVILFVVLATGAATVLSSAFRFTDHAAVIADRLAYFEEMYETNLTAVPDASWSEAETDRYGEALNAFSSDPEAVAAYTRAVPLILLITTFSLLLATVVLEFIIPLAFRDGQTVGKRVFSLGVIRTDCVRMPTLQLFIRAILGKFTLEIMLPTYLVIQSVIGQGGLLSLGVAGLIALMQFILPVFTRYRTPLHDLLAGTAVVDLPSQKVFRDTPEMIEYTKALHRERATDPQNSNDWKELR